MNSIARVTVTSQGQQTNGNVTGAAMSGDGRYVVFASGASNIVNGDLNDKEDIFLRDLELGTTVLASITPRGGFPDDHSQFPAISADGSYLAYRHVSGTLVAGDTSDADIILTQRATLTHSLASLSFSGGDANLAPRALVPFLKTVVLSPLPLARPTMSPATATVEQTRSCLIASIRRPHEPLRAQQDSKETATRCGLTYLPMGTSSFSKQVRPISPQTTQIHSTTYSSKTCWTVDHAHQRHTAGELASLGASSPTISADGQRVAFSSVSSNLFTNDTNGLTDIFVRDVQDGTTRLVSVSSSGAPGNSTSQDPFISGNGRYVAFTSFASNLVQGDGNATSDAFVHDLETSKTYLVSMTPMVAPGTSFQMQSISLMMAGTSLFPLLPAIWLPTTPMEKPTFFVVDGLNLWWFG